MVFGCDHLDADDDEASFSADDDDDTTLPALPNLQELQAVLSTNQFMQQELV